ncbi:MAG: glycosyl transferase [Elusimicrobia bacterium]|nr:glycosyl transferase [Elusimicrobiota bacterium]
MNGWHHARNVVAARVGGSFELLAATPALRALKRAVPGRRITLLTGAASVAVARLLPEVDEVFAYDPPWAPDAPARRESIDWAALQRLRRRRFEAAVIFTGKGESALPAALLFYLAGVPRRLGRGPGPCRLLTDGAPESAAPCPELRRQLDLVSRVGCPADDERVSLNVPPEARRGIGHLLEDLGLAPGRPWALVWADGMGPARLAESLPAALAKLAAGGVPIVFAGQAYDEGRCESIRERMHAPSVSLVGRLAFAELSALVERAPALIAEGQEGALVARALGTPVVRV